MNIGFCGHRYVENRAEVEAILYNAVEVLINMGAENFYIGSYGDFDFIAAKTIRNLKNKYPYIKSINIIPYINKEVDYNLFDSSEYPPIENTPKKYAIIKANEYMVNKSDVIVSYIRNTYGGAYKTYRYAMKRDKRVIKI